MLPPSLQHWCSLVSFHPHRTRQARCQGASMLSSPSPACLRSLGSDTLCGSAASLLRVAICSGRLGCPFSSSRPSVPSFPHLQPTHLLPLLFRLRPSAQASSAASTVEVPRRDLGKRHLLVAALPTQRRWRGQCHTVPCSVVSPRFRRS